MCIRDRVNDDPEIYGAMDTELSGSSAVIPVALKADGSLKATSKTASTEEFGTMSDYVKETVTKAGRRILGGDVAAAPYELDGRSGCDYCPYHMVCGFDARIPGFSYRKLEKPDGAEAILAKMRETQNEELSLIHILHPKDGRGGTDGGDGARQPCRADDCGGRI